MSYDVGKVCWSDRTFSIASEEPVGLEEDSVGGRRVESVGDRAGPVALRDPAVVGTSGWVRIHHRVTARADGGRGPTGWGLPRRVLLTPRCSSRTTASFATTRRRKQCPGLIHLGRFLRITSLTR